jgi:hypothetical protein
LALVGRRFSLSDVPGVGVSCGENGLFVGGVPLLERVCDSGEFGLDQWRLRPASALNRDLSACYGLPVEVDRKIDGLVAVSQALSRGDMMHAQIATLHLEIPDPPTLAKSIQTPDDILDLARRLRSSGMLKADWDPTQHPRWPAGSPGGIGGEFAPAGTAYDDATSTEQSTNGHSGAEPNASVIPAQLTLPVPFDFPIPPLPSEILPPPVIPNTYPRDLPRNPYPDRPECEEEWAEATDYCLKLKARNLLGRGDYSGSGRTLSQCIMGRVSQDCGGNSTGA